MWFLSACCLIIWFFRQDLSVEGELVLNCNSCRVGLGELSFSALLGLHLLLFLPFHFLLAFLKADSAHRCGTFLESGNVRSLQTLGSLSHFEFNGLAVVQRFVAVALDSRKMNENVFAGLALNETKALARVEPLYRSLFSHFVSLFCLSCLVPLFRLQAKIKGRKFGLAAPFIIPKGFTRATNAVGWSHSLAAASSNSGQCSF
jgi:hypothetical protein